MKRSWRNMAAAGLAVALLAAAWAYGPAALDAAKEGTAMAAEGSASSAVSTASQRTITVSGIGKVSVTPDVADVHFGVMTKAPTANEAQAENAKIFAAVETVLKEQFGVAQKDIRTSGFAVHPEYQWQETRKESVIAGYTASHTVTVTYRDLDGLGALLDAVSKAGANQMNGIRFGAESTDAYELQAIEKAMENARAKADAIAKAAGSSVKGVLHVTQGASGGGAPVPMVRAELAMMDASGASTSVQPGQLDITVTVNVVYEM